MSKEQDHLDGLRRNLITPEAFRAKVAADPDLDCEVRPAEDNLTHLVAAFSEALLAKLRAAEVKYRRKDDWERDDWPNECQRKLLEHVAKGDPLDVAAYAAFCWHHGWSTAADPNARQVGWMGGEFDR